MNKTLLQVLGLCICPNFRYSSNCLAEIYRASMITPCWCPSVVNQYDGRKILWISGTNFGYLGDWLSVLKKQALFLHEISIYFSTNASYAWWGLKKCFRFQKVMIDELNFKSSVIYVVEMSHSFESYTPAPKCKLKAFKLSCVIQKEKLEQYIVT